MAKRIIVMLEFCLLVFRRRNLPSSVSIATGGVSDTLSRVLGGGCVGVSTGSGAGRMSVGGIFGIR